MPKDALTTAVQRSIDDFKYPPTHQYNVRTLEPHGVLAERVKIILQLCPDFFMAQRFLDVGASKGFFSLKAAQSSAEVMALDQDAKVLKLWRRLCPANVQQVQGPFRKLNWGIEGLFDLIWIGNGHHYLHREDPGGWIPRLSCLASDRVLIEGAVGAKTPGFSPSCGWPPSAVPEEAAWLARAARYGLHFQEAAPSPSYTPGRKIWYLRKTHS